MVSTCCAARSARRMAWFSVSAMYRLSPCQGHPLGVVQHGGTEVAIGHSFVPGADDLLHLAFQGGHDDPVVVSVGDEQVPTGPVCQHLAGKRQRPARLTLRGEPHRSAVDEAIAVELRHHAAEQVVEVIVGQFALVLANDLALGVDEHEGWPGPAGILLPDLELGVVDYGVLKLIALHGLVDVGPFLLIGELGRMNADDHQLACILLFQFPQLRKNVCAVDSTVGPEVEDHDLASQLLHGQGAVSVDPFQPLGELRGIDLAGERCTGHDYLTNTLAALSWRLMDLSCRGFPATRKPG